MFEPMIRMQSAFCRSCWKVVAPPRPNEVPRPGTVEECHMRAWFSIWTTPSAREQLLDAGSSPRCPGWRRRGWRCPACGAASGPRRPATATSAGGSRSPGRRSCPSPRRGRAPPTPSPCGRRYLTRCSRCGPVTSCLDADALRAEPAARDRAVGVALDLGDPLVLDVDPLAAADRAVRADRLAPPGRRRRCAGAAPPSAPSARPSHGRSGSPLQLPEQRPAGHEAAELAHPESIVPTRIAGETHAGAGGTAWYPRRGAGGR